MLLADQAAPEMQGEFASGGVYTTSAWYYRLARAAHDTRFLGALSRQVEALPHPIAPTASSSGSAQLCRREGSVSRSRFGGDVVRPGPPRSWNAGDLRRHHEDHRSSNTGHPGSDSG